MDAITRTEAGSSPRSRALRTSASAKHDAMDPSR
ncbi:hypothetical protein H4W81_001789 [Nonomuraea africana]|uniref:Uncharacterized protein n=1 Tax=Nonomuraea africana TaxID=46171 RepID=A0ABR9KAH2_9ACTN|nr:hypothetical protein [Nonomuraea africana]